eukprot:CAMPEP_0183361070 /NCGR_PEP_ID=MMETSP0164_2-20130417/56230_1 /TAXON_ID=221442 /ORGANISM="Coccolithus pelagicus ssp braarudi, Strain PLY182g" /LENGTH=93 /DNA_ID=CAMNT_0025535523 /DNA_START=23 /DNA_END=305 /DNA_ORIENTATION=-
MSTGQGTRRLRARRLSQSAASRALQEVVLSPHASVPGTSNPVAHQLGQPATSSASQSAVFHLSATGTGTDGPGKSDTREVIRARMLQKLSAEV